MAWRDEVRRLDEDLAAGRISADEHQRRRDELTAQADTERVSRPEWTGPPAPAGTFAQRGEPAQSGESAQSGEPAQSDQPAQASTPVQPGGPGPGGGPPNGSAPPVQDGAPDQGNQQPGNEQHSPFPPAFRWDSTPPSETTQVIHPIGNGDAESTQVLRAPEPPPGPSYDDSERTQVVQAGPPAPPRFGEPQFSGGGYPASGDPWASQESAPPWMSSEPIQEPNAGWMMQGPESFEAEPKESGTMRIVAVAAAVVVLLAVGIGAYFLFQPGGSRSSAGDGTTTEPPVAVAPQPPPNPAPPAQTGPPLASLPGQQLDTSEFRDFAQVRQLGYFTEGELEAMYAAGPSEAALALSTRGNNKLIILVVRADDAATARDRLADLQVQFKLNEMDGPVGVRVAGSDTVATGDPVLRRAHYASGDYVVRVQASGDSDTEVDQLFQDILSAQQAKLPADG